MFLRKRQSLLKIAVFAHEYHVFYSFNVFFRFLAESHFRMIMKLHQKISLGTEMCEMKSRKSDMSVMSQKLQVRAKPSRKTVPFFQHTFVLYLINLEWSWPFIRIICAFYRGGTAEVRILPWICQRVQLLQRVHPTFATGFSWLWRSRSLGPGQVVWYFCIFCGIFRLLDMK